MSFSLAIKDGDLAMLGSSLQVVSGTPKLEQDLSIWLRERYKSDRFHRNYGSVLDAFIGSIISRSTQSEVRSEVLRVLSNYQALQYRRVKETPQLLSPEEILLEVLEVTTNVSYDTVSVAIRIRTAKQYETIINVGTEL